MVRKAARFQRHVIANQVRIRRFVQDMRTAPSPAGVVRLLESLPGRDRLRRLPPGDLAAVPRAVRREGNGETAKRRNGEPNIEHRTSNIEHRTPTRNRKPISPQRHKDTENPRLRANPKSEVRSADPNPQSAIRNPQLEQSAIRIPQSDLRSPMSEDSHRRFAPPPFRTIRPSTGTGPPTRTAITPGRAGASACPCRAPTAPTAATPTCRAGWRRSGSSSRWPRCWTPSASTSRLELY